MPADQVAAAWERRHLDAVGDLIFLISAHFRVLGGCQAGLFRSTRLI
jgi:hypothetical protein